MNLDRQLLNEYLKITITVAVMSFFLFFAGTKFNLIDISSLTKTAIVLLVLWLAFLLIGKTRRLSADVPIAVSIGVMLFTSLTGDMPRQAFVEVGYLLIAILIFYFVVGLMHRGWNPKILSKSILIIGGVFMILSWMEFLAWYLRWLNYNPGDFIPDLPYRLPAPNFICVILNVWILFALGHLFYVKEKFPRILLGLYILSGLGIIYLTSSRGGWIGLFGGIFVFAAVFLLKKHMDKVKWAFTQLKKPKILIPILLVFFLAIAGVAKIMLGTESHPTHGPIFQSRALLWNPAFTAIPESPIIGHGPYAYIFYYLNAGNLPQYQLFDYAHSIYFDALVSSGVLGLIVLLWLIFAAGKMLFKTLAITDDYLFYLGLGVIGSFSAFVFHGFVDSVHHTVPVSLWNMCILLAIPAGYLSRENQKRNFVPIVIGVLLFPALIWYLIAGNTLLKGTNLAIQGELEPAIEQLTLAEEQDPYLPFIPQQKGIVYAQLAAATGQENYLILAKDAFEKTIEADQSWAPTYLNLATIDNTLGNTAEAEENYQKAVALSPNGSLYIWNMAVFYEEQEKYDLAEEAYLSCLALDGRIILSDEWNASEFRKSISETWMLENQDLYADFEKVVMDTRNALLAVQYTADANDPAKKLYYVNQASEELQDGTVDKALQTLNIGQLAYTNRTESSILSEWLYGEIDAENGDYESAVLSGETAINAVLKPGLYGPGSYSQQVYGPVVYRRQEIPDYYIPQVNQTPITYEWVQRINKLADWYAEIGNSSKEEYWINIANKISEN
jgi:O-antigen ligase/tetratricopeptide (TPR) repeat protein